MKKSVILLACLTFAGALHAQLKVTSDGKVQIASNQSTSYAKLLVGSTQFGGNNTNMGISGSTTATGNKNNIGILGTVAVNSSLTSDKNYGVLGIVSPMNTAHGKNYGLCGMIGFTGDHYGGAGLYATSYTYFFSNPTNIQGDYAGYFAGAVNVGGNLTTPNVYIPSDSRLSENVVALNARGEETNTLDNLLGMNVIEYSMKSRVLDEMPASIEEDETGMKREAYERLKRDETEMSSRRHFGIDAKELQKVYPDLVLEGQDGYLSINYVELVPLLIRSMQELKAELDELKSDNARLTRASVGTGSALDGQDGVKGDLQSTTPGSGNMLFQNTPNPFREQTAIRFRLADDTRDAHICIFDMAGKMLRKAPVSVGMDSISVSGWELGEGMFLYSLVVNGQEVDTKRMIITK